MKTNVEKGGLEICLNCSEPGSCWVVPMKHSKAG